jgi:hypothetical protein
MVVSAVFEGKEAIAVPASSMYGEKSISAPGSSTSATDPINNKVWSLPPSPYSNLVFYFMLFWVVPWCNVVESYCVL